MTDTIEKQILDIRDSGLTNMFDINMVHRIAYDREYYELAVYIEEHREDYVNFIFTGKRK